ncbi:CRISPR-associated protein Cas4 [Candidatus Desantisbacteria bacterium CG_4_10_14_0_8_um_filter_48_22]|uniref:CRISPR-associated exonuclease Cas4 n=1 Tax=Candidatus Desantisbacteria bacterium CG_4_10_14_0_8_um_filter_48_22 TaxID=1974543 RepID=A0A2M7SED8_9BACT|nr:MAG: CRISPR-associated protein Cas4 [Candidatus Desantisbacteria bacterium CG_4_10_14_0_8_um_filter_48_22]
MYSEDDFLQLSALQHFIFCPRQCALIHIEQIWVENLFTAEGRIMHDKVHEEHIENRKDIRIERGIPLRSNELGLNGKADVVEFHKDEQGGWIPFLVEYKRGKPKPDDSDKIQLCAQALCLEEMLDIKISCGAIFYGKTRHRFDVVFDDVLQKETQEAVRQLHIFIEAGNTPAPLYAPKCDSCSFVDECLPKTIERKLSIKDYLLRETKEQ